MNGLVGVLRLRILQRLCFWNQVVYGALLLHASGEVEAVTQINK
jgi:hypothetical protein